MAGFFKHYLRSRGAVVGYCAGCGGIFAVVFALYGLPLEAVLYPGALCLLLGAAVLGLDLLRQRCWGWTCSGSGAATASVCWCFITWTQAACRPPKPRRKQS